MKHRPLLFIVLAFAAGIFLDYSVPLPFILLLGLTFCAMVFCWGSLFVWRTGLLYMAACLVIAFWAGAAYHHVRFYLYPADQIANLVTEDKRLMRLRGVIADIPLKRQMAPPPLPWKQAKAGRPYSLRFPLGIKELKGNTGWYGVGGVALVNIYGNKFHRYNYGQMVEVLGNAFIPYGPRNPGQFDYRRYLQRQSPGIRVMITVENTSNVRVIGEDGGSTFFQGLYGLKERFADVIRSSAFPGSDTTMAGLVLGNRSEIPREVIEDFRRTGTLHFLAISGLHVGILVLTVYSLLLFLGVPKRIVIMLIIVLASLYALLTGMRPPVLRATLMVIFIFGAYLVRRQWDFGSGIAAAVLAMLIWNPSDLFNVGFQLSVAGVLGIVYLAPVIESFFWGGSLLVEHLQVEEDHYNGLPALIERFRVRKVLVNERLLYSEGAAGLLGFLADRGVPVEVIERGAVLEGLGGASVKVLNPPGGASGLSANDASCVLMIEYDGKGVLLCGDIERRGIENLLESGYDLNADVILAPHHGNRISNVGELYKTVRPRYILVSTGSNKDLSAQRPEGSVVLQTSEAGALFLKIGARGVRTWTYSGEEIVDD